MKTRIANSTTVRFTLAALAAAAGLAATADAGIIGRAVVGNQLYYLNDNGALTGAKTISYQAYSGIGYIGLAKSGSGFIAVSRTGVYSNYYPQQVFAIGDTGNTATAALLNNTNWNLFTEGDCAIDPTTGDLWAVKPGGQLYRFVNNTFNNGTLIGTIPGANDASAMAFTTGGNLYVLDFAGNGRISRIDKTNASIISSAYSSIPLYSCDAGMYFNPANGGELIISANGVYGNNSGQLLMKTSAATGAATFLGPTTPTQGIVVTSGTSSGINCFWLGSYYICAEIVAVNFNNYTSTELVAGHSMWQIDTTAIGTAQDARIVTTQGDPVSPPRQAASIDPGTAIAQIGTFEHGQWSLTTDLYVPTSPTPGGAAGVSLLSNIDLATGVRSEAATITIDSANGMLISSMGTALPLQRDQWGTLRIDVDLDTSTQSAFYNGMPLYVGMPWFGGTPGGGGAIRGVSFWNQNAGAFLVGSVSLMPTGATPTCVADVDDGSGTGTPDNGVTIDDLLYYLQIFEAGELAADVDDGSGTGTQDGGVTIDDLLYYLQRFESGC